MANTNDADENAAAQDEALEEQKENAANAHRDAASEHEAQAEEEENA
jgi:hypothetical protein